MHFQKYHARKKMCGEKKWQLQQQQPPQPPQPNEIKENNQTERFFIREKREYKERFRPENCSPRAYEHTHTANLRMEKEYQQQHGFYDNITGNNER